MSSPEIYFVARQSPYSSYKLLELFMTEADNQIDRKELVIAAVVQNNVDFLKEQLENDSEAIDYLKIINEADGNNLLQIAIIHHNTEVFDYLLSLGHFPLEHSNNEGERALTLALNGFDTFYEHVLYELIKRGASVQDLHLEYGESLLHFVVESAYVQVTILLMEMGHNLNDLDDFGFTPLWGCLLVDKVKTELVCALLAYGADPTVGNMDGYNMFEFAVEWCSETVIEQFFYYFFDEYTQMDIHFETLMILAEKESQYFYETLEHTNRVVLGFFSYGYCHLLLFIKTEYLKKLIEKCGDVIRQVFVQPRDLTSIRDKLVFDNVNALLETDFRCDVISFIVDLSNKCYFNCLIGYGYDESSVLERLCFLLSYGLIIKESTVQLFYERYGYGELLRILLHMDIMNDVTHKVNNFWKSSIRDAKLRFIYDITLDLDTFLKIPHLYYLRNRCELLHYFVHPKLKELCTYFNRTIISQPDVPLLVELARNSFRKFFVEKFDIKTTKQFYSLLNGLPISRTHKKIITFETPLY